MSNMFINKTQSISFENNTTHKKCRISEFVRDDSKESFFMDFQ